MTRNLQDESSDCCSQSDWSKESGDPPAANESSSLEDHMEKADTDAKNGHATELFNQIIADDWKAELNMDSANHIKGDEMEVELGIEATNQKEDVTLVTENVAPDGGYGWVIVIGAFLVHVLMGGFERSQGVFFLQLRKKFDQSATNTAWVTSINSTLRLLLGPVGSALCNRFSIRKVTMLGSFLASLSLFVSAFSTNLHVLYFTYGVLGGLGRSLTYTPSLVIVGYYFNKRRGLAVGIATSGVGLGTMFFPPIIEVMFEYYGYWGTFLILAAVTANFFVCGALFRPLSVHRKMIIYERLKKEKKANKAVMEAKQKLLVDKPLSIALDNNCINLLHTDPTALVSSSTTDITANVKLESRRPSLFKKKYSQIKSAFKTSKKSNQDKPKLFDFSLFKHFGFTTLCLQLFLFTLSFNTTFTFLPALAKERGIDPLYGAYLISILGIFDAVSRIVMSTVLDMVKIRPYRLIIYNLTLFLIGGISLLIPSMKSFVSFACVSGSYGVLSGLYISQKSVVCVDMLGVKHLTNSFGLLLSFQGAASFIGPTIGALLKDKLGSYGMSFYVGSVGIFLGAFTMLLGNYWLHQQKKKAKTEQQQQQQQQP